MDLKYSYLSLSTTPSIQAPNKTTQEISNQQVKAGILVYCVVKCNLTHKTQTIIKKKWWNLVTSTSSFSRIQMNEVVRIAMIVPMGMDLWGSLRSPDLLDPAIIPETHTNTHRVKPGYIENYTEIMQQRYFSMHKMTSASRPQDITVFPLVWLIFWKINKFSRVYFDHWAKVLQHHSSPAKTQITPQILHSCFKSNFIFHINSQCHQTCIVPLLLCEHCWKNLKCFVTVAGDHWNIPHVQLSVLAQSFINQGYLTNFFSS